MSKTIETIDPRALKQLTGYPFPRNVRELKNMIERAFIFAKADTLAWADLGIQLSPSRTVTSSSPLRDVEKRVIKEALQRWEGNRTRASRELGITRKTLLKKIRQYGLD
jgi:DNA-binding NtrC family response regulator